MAKFIVRVELHGAERDDYDKLHQLMKSSGYNRQIQDTDFTWFNLPTAEYVLIANTNATSVRNTALTIAQKVRESCGILVTEVSDIAWYLSKTK